MKFLALQGGTRHPVHISSIRLSKNLEISQQSASRYLIELVDEGFVDRRLAQGGQIVTILEKGIVILRKEFSEYSLMFGTQREIEMKGTLETGLGEGGYYISKKGYMHQFKEKLGWEPFMFKIIKGYEPKIETYLAGDEDLIKADEKYEYTKLKVEFLESIIKSLNTRGYNIRSAIDFLKFTMGS